MEPVQSSPTDIHERKRPSSAEPLSDTKKRTKPSSSSLPAPIVLFATRDRERTVNDRSFREMLGLDINNKEEEGSLFTINSMVLGNYRIDFEFLLHEIPELLTIPQVTLFYGHGSHVEYLTQWKQATQVDAILVRPSDPPRSAHNPLPWSVPYGVHHSKIILLAYRKNNDNKEQHNQENLRVIIHTANLLERDIHCKIQGAYIQDFPRKAMNATAPSCFEDDLVAYLDTYDYTRHRTWSPTLSPCSLTHWLRQYDFSSAQVALVPSTPGYHRLTNVPEHTHRALTGHLRIPQLIRQYCSNTTKRQSSGPVVCQFSSMGSLTAKYLEELYQSMNVTSALRPKDERPSKVIKVPLAQRLQLVYPTVEQIRDSYEGYAGGGSVPGPLRNVSKAFLRPLYHVWSNDGRKHVGHIKTYYQRSDPSAQPTADTMEWFVLTSHNLSKAAWGEVQMRAAGRRLFVRHWELGVWLCPSEERPLAPYGTSIPNAMTVPLPYPVRPVPYRASDQPWAVDGVYEIPDAFGRIQRE